MPVIAKFCGIVIRLLTLRSFGNRIHAFYGDEELVLDLDEMRIVSGHLPDRVLRMVMAWARQHRDEIFGTLRRLQSRDSRLGVCAG